MLRCKYRNFLSCPRSSENTYSFNYDFHLIHIKIKTSLSLRLLPNKGKILCGLLKKSVNSFLSHIPSIAAGVLVGGVVIASGGSGFQSGVAAIATGASGFATSALLIQSQARKQDKLQGNLEQERDRLKQDVERQRNRHSEEVGQLRQALPFGSELEDLQRRRELLQQSVSELKWQEEDLHERVRLVQQNHPSLEELEQRQQKIGELKTQISENRGRLTAVVDQIAEREKQRDGLQEVTSQFSQKQEQVNDLTEQLRKLNQQAAELELFRSTYDALRTDWQNLETKKQHLQAEIPRIKQERDRILVEIGTMESKAQQVDGLRVQIENLEAALRSKRSELGSLAHQIDQLNSEKMLLDGQIAARKNELEELQKKIRDAKDEFKKIADEKAEAFKALNISIWDKVKIKEARHFASELEFLSSFKEYLKTQGLSFPNRVINAFYTSLKVQDISALVILAGISGTGKSQLPKAFSNFIGAPLVNLPVQPRWDSPQDLQGFYNYIEKKYKPTDLMHYLYQYGRDSRLKGRICLVLLDEMNLARVEYYFSDFLSKLEDRRNLDERPYIDLEVGSLDLSPTEKKVYIPDEFLFIGTMNEDETTQTLSDKVLDRANVLTFGRPNQLKLLNQQKVKSVSSQGYLPWSDFRQWVKKPSDNPLLCQEVKRYVDEANGIMELLGRPFAHRVFQAFTKYVCNYPNADRDEVRNQAIADQFGQKLLPKLRGVMVEEKNVEEALDRMESLLSQLNDEPLNKAFKKAREGQYGQFQWKGMVYSQD